MIGHGLPLHETNRVIAEQRMATIHYIGEEAEMTPPTMDEGELAGLIADLLLSEADEEVASVTTFAASGLLTNDTGIVVKTADGREFQVTVVLSDEPLPGREADW